MTAAVETTPASRVWKRIIIAVLLASLMGAGVYGFSIVQQFIPVEPDEVFHVLARIDGEERPVQVEAFLSTIGRNARHPTILDLHGVEGADRYPAAHTRSCRGLADQGYAMFYVHYFDSVNCDDLGHLREDDSLDPDVIDHRCGEDARR